MDNTESSSKPKNNKCDIKYLYWNKEDIEDIGVMTALVKMGCTMYYSRRNRGYIVLHPNGEVIWKV